MTRRRPAFHVACVSFTNMATTEAESFGFSGEQDFPRQPEIAPGNSWLRENLGGDSAPHTLGSLVPRLAPRLDARTSDAQLACPCPLHGRSAFGAVGSLRSQHGFAMGVPTKEGDRYEELP